jgi:hypothetical protein
MLSRSLQKTLILCAFSVLGVGVSQAAPLTTGSAILASGGAGPAGGSLVATDSAPFSTANYSGTLTSQVILNDPANPFGPGNLTFTYQLQNDAPSTDGLGRMTVSSFNLAGILLDASYQSPAPAGSVLPTSFDRNTADVVGVSFTSAPLGLGLVNPGSGSALLVIQTNTSSFQSSLASIIDGLPATAASFAPVAVPEPTTLALTCLIGLAGWRRR